MNRKSLVCGFGVGVLFSAIILGVSFMVRTSDSFVKSRAKELGMVYASQDSGKVLDEEKDKDTDKDNKKASANPEASPQASPEGNSTAAPKATKAPKNTQAPRTTPAPTSAATQKPAASGKPSQKDIDMKQEKDRMEKSIRNEEKKLTINAGEWSSDVSRKLEQLGVVKSAKDFDAYLEKNGYSGGISAGTYNVSKGDTYSQLAKKITRR